MQTIQYLPQRRAGLGCCRCNDSASAKPLTMLPHVCARVAAFVVAFTAVIVGWALSLDYSAKLFTMTFVLVIMGSERASGMNHCTATAIHC